jgi:hypothetical protein
MKPTIVALSLLMCLNSQVYAQEMLEVSAVEKDIVAQELEKEAQSAQHDSKTKKTLKKVAEVFRQSKQRAEVEVKSLDDCANCENKSKGQIILRNLGRKLGRGSAWLSTATGKPFMNASAFLTGLLENKDKNQEVVALYQFFLNHQSEFDGLYLEAGTPEEMMELMLVKMEEIMEEKSKTIMSDFLAHLGLKKEIPQDFSDFELSPAEIASLDQSKINVSFINQHPAFQEVKPLIGELTQQDLQDIVMSGYFDKTISFENYKEALPKVHEGVGMIIGQIYAPQIALKVVSRTLAGLYALPVVAADIGTGASAAICLQGETQEKFSQDQDLRSFCSFVTNRTGYELVKGRAKGFVKGKKTRVKIEQKLEERRLRREARRTQGA